MAAASAVLISFARFDFSQIFTRPFSIELSESRRVRIAIGMEGHVCPYLGALTPFLQAQHSPAGSYPTPQSVGNLQYNE